MIEYPKIETVFVRSEDGKRKLIEGAYRNKAVEYLKNAEWEWTEKVDGTNIRVHWDGYKVEIGGRTDNAQIPARLYKKLETIFKTDEAEELFEQKFGIDDVILFGEGFGFKIQKCGADYIPNDNDFCLFDVLINDVWLDRMAVHDIAQAFGVPDAPVVGTGNIESAVKFVKSHPKSQFGTAYMEGLVGRPSAGLLDRLGRRIIVKVKYRDFESEEKNNETN